MHCSYVKSPWPQLTCLIKTLNLPVYGSNRPSNYYQFFNQNKNSTNWGSNNIIVTGIEQTRYTRFYTQTKTKNTFHLTEPCNKLVINVCIWLIYSKSILIFWSHLSLVKISVPARNFCVRAKMAPTTHFLGPDISRKGQCTSIFLICKREETIGKLRKLKLTWSIPLYT